MNFFHPLLQSTSQCSCTPLPAQRLPAQVLWMPPLSTQGRQPQLLCSPLHGHLLLPRARVPWGPACVCTRMREGGLRGEAHLQPQGLLDLLPGSARHAMARGKRLQGPSATVHPQAFIRERECRFPTGFPNSLIPSLPVKQELFLVRLPAPSGVFAKPSSSRITAGLWLLSCSDPSWLSHHVGLSQERAARAEQPGAWPHHGSPRFLPPASCPRFE